jgi:hypothetical protein
MSLEIIQQFSFNGHGLFYIREFTKSRLLLLARDILTIRALKKTALWVLSVLVPGQDEIRRGIADLSIYRKSALSRKGGFPPLSGRCCSPAGRN